jgi:hypothetical protein
LNKDINVNGELNLSNGLLSIGDNDLTLATGGSISRTASTFIVATGNGELRKRLTGPTGLNPFIFPVGSAVGGGKYTPVTLDFNSATFGSSAYVGVRVADQVNALMNTTGNSYLNRTWIVEPNDITGYEYTISLQYANGDFVQQNGAVVEANLYPVKRSIQTNTWHQPADGPFPGTPWQGYADLVFNRVLTWSGLTTFSEFGGAGGTGNPLPVELTTFSGSCDDEKIAIEWKTVSEHNSSHFDLEESRDGENWKLLSTEQAAENSNQEIIYNAIDNDVIDGNNYYRLLQFDVDGKFKIYGPINVTCAEVVKGYFSSFPNPSGQAFQVIVNNKDLIGNSTLNIVDSKGTILNQLNVELKDGINMFVVNESLAPGIYFINITNGTKSTEVIRHAVK